MIRRRLSIAGVALVAFGVISGVAGAPAAHANEFPSLPSATATMQCEPDGYWEYDHSNWHVHLANDSFAKKEAHFEVTYDANPPEQYTLQPGETHDEVVEAPDGVPTTLLITADGSTLVSKSLTTNCNTPEAWMGFGCGVPTAGKYYPALSFSYTNSTDKHIYVEFHSDKGGLLYSYTMWDQEGKWVGFHESYSEGEHYHGWLTFDGVKQKELEGTVDCEKTPTSTPPTSVPPTTTPKQPHSTTTTTVVAAESAVATPTTAAPAGTLPFTGGSSTPLAIIGSLMLSLGAAALLAVRRRAARA
jgi:LPXTG-motif cell wall-anchored protein